MNTNKELPTISWPDFLRAAPWFSAELFDAVAGKPFDTLPPLARAACYWEIFSSEVANGGITQYLYNQGDSLAQFPRAPEFVAVHPALVEGLPFIQQAHAAWEQVADDVRQARESGDWPEALFTQYAPLFNELEEAMFQVLDSISCRLNQHIVQSPDDYFRITPLQGVAESGISWVEHRTGNTVHYLLRFVDSFPVGPNIFELKDGTTHIVRFSAGRDLLTIEKPNYSGYRQLTVHYPTQLNTVWDFKKSGQLEGFHTQQALSYRHGLQEIYDDAGNISRLELNLNNTPVHMSYFAPSGTVACSHDHWQQREYRSRYWPSGQLNTRSVLDLSGDVTRERYLECRDEKGSDLLVNGCGQLYEILSFDADGTIQRWREGEVVNGYLNGHRIWKDQTGEIDRETFREGYLQS
ncbi:hypothetical protein PGO42_08725 [Klebsiella aerogenes]